MQAAEHTPLASATTRPATAKLVRLRLPPRYAAVALGGALICIAYIPSGFVSDPGTPRALAVVLPVAMFGAFACLLLAGANVTMPAALRRAYARLRPLALAGTALLALAGAFGLLICVCSVLGAPAVELYTRDVTAFTHFDAQLLLTGHNPYTADAAFRQAILTYPGGSPTPIRNAAFGPAFDYPSGSLLGAVEHRFLAGDPRVAGAFDPRTLHSYPALAYLLYVPALALHLPNILIINVLALVALYVWLLRVAPESARRWTLLLAVADITIPFGSLLFDTEVICIALLLPAWHYRDRRYLGPVLLGLACAFKQYSWFFAAFFLIDAARARGWREAGRRGLLALATFLLPNLPFLIASPGEWWSSLWLPLSDPMYPRGIGLIALPIGHLLPYVGPPLYLALELLAFGACLWAAWRLSRQLGDGVLLLALVPLCFAFRSPADYFAFAPILALYAVNRDRRAQTNNIIGSQHTLDQEKAYAH